MFGSLLIFGCGSGMVPEITSHTPSSLTQTVNVGESIDFSLGYTASSTCVSNFQFEDGDVDKTTEKNMTYKFEDAGTSTVKMWVTDEDGVSSDVIKYTITVKGDDPIDPVDPTDWPIHTWITASTFWVGEGATSDNDFINNQESAWDGTWGTKFGLEDKPLLSRDGDNIPISSKFNKSTSNCQNPYYFALPYDDFGSLVYDGDGSTIKNAAVDSDDRKKSSSHVYWATGSYDSNKSKVKNRWIKIWKSASSSSNSCYAQWEDAGPYYYDDYGYVFGTAKPANTTDVPNAGIDLSPSVMLYLGAEMEYWGAELDVSWTFVDEKDVPDGPWKKYVTTTQVDW